MDIKKPKKAISEPIKEQKQIDAPLKFSEALERIVRVKPEKDKKDK